MMLTLTVNPHTIQHLEKVVRTSYGGGEEEEEGPVSVEAALSWAA